MLKQEATLVSVSGLQELDLLVSLCALTVPAIPQSDFVRPPFYIMNLSIYHFTVCVELQRRKSPQRNTWSICEDAGKFSMVGFHPSN